jgi:hypothetical protein
MYATTNGARDVAIFIYLLVGSGGGYTLTVGTPASIDVWVATVRHLSQTHAPCFSFFCTTSNHFFLLLSIARNNLV